MPAHEHRGRLVMRYYIAGSKAVGMAVLNRRSGELKMSRDDLARALGWTPGTREAKDRSGWSPSTIYRIEQKGEGIRTQADFNNLSRVLGLTPRDLKARIGALVATSKPGDSDQLADIIDAIADPDLRFMAQRIADDLTALARALGESSGG